DPSGLEDYPGTHVSLQPEEPRGYGVDFLANRQFLESTAKDGVVRVPSGATYRALVLPEAWAASLATLKQVDAFVNAGVPVYGPAPTNPTGLVDLKKNADEWKALVARLWGDGKSPRVQPGDKFTGANLVAAKISPDFSYKEEKDADVRFIH